MYSSAMTGEYFFSIPGPEQLGKQDISASKFGLQKKAMDWRAGAIPSVSGNCSAGGATTRCNVERRRSLLQRASRSPTFTTIVPGWKKYYQ
jgi:hypothetical protein